MSLKADSSFKAMDRHALQGKARDDGERGKARDDGWACFLRGSKARQTKHRAGF
ncbi:hypothetical protein [Helicobacter canis]|uniref:hypothetical protein n=1 Tax=Helicobacter canis TaxID=29419 RepID=UPI0015F0C7AC|nr:hypothetical protein [Helicobacter canis]